MVRAEDRHSNLESAGRAVLQLVGVLPPAEVGATIEVRSERAPRRREA